MGVFDTILFACPVCGNQIEKQSKAGDCRLNDYDQCVVPVEISKALENTEVDCSNCGNTFVVKYAFEVPKTAPMVLRPK
jgi:hypothetical protein